MINQMSLRDQSYSWVGFFNVTLYDTNVINKTLT